MVRHATVRAAADLLGMSHSTVARRIIALENGLGVRLFDRTAHGYNLTPAGKDILATAESMEREVMTLERRVVGRDQSLRTRACCHQRFSGDASVDPSLPAFGRQYPEINVEIVTGYESLDIDRREADIALRITPKPPPHLVGKRLAAVAFAPFVSRDYLVSMICSRAHRAGSDISAMPRKSLPIGYTTALTRTFQCVCV